MSLVRVMPITIVYVNAECNINPNHVQLYLFKLKLELLVSND